MAFETLKVFLPERPVRTRIWHGPFRGARIVMSPRNSLRKVFGLYEHELSGWLDQALRRVTRVLDIGANDGYYTFGCAAAFRRLGKACKIIAFEPQAGHTALLRESLVAQPASSVRVEIVQTFVGNVAKPGIITLDSVEPAASNPAHRNNTLIKIDVDGLEMEVIEGGRSWLRPANLFMIEVHKREFLDRLRAIFAQHDLRLRRVNQRPLPLLGREMRGENNCWLVSEIGDPSDSPQSFRSSR